jgi:16S rRNA processing protein RimM
MYLIGYVTKPHGIRGEVKVEPVTPDPDRFNQLDKVHLRLKDSTRTYSIKKVRVSDRFVYIKFAGVNSRNDAELLRNAEVLIEEKDLIQPAQDEFFIHDLIGCQVVSEDKEHIGVLEDVVQVTSNDVYVVKKGDGTELLIPATKEVVKQVDIRQKIIVIHVLEGLFD